MSPDFDFWDRDDSPEPKEKFACKHLRIVQPEGFDTPELVCNRDERKGKFCEGSNCKSREVM